MMPLHTECYFAQCHLCWMLFVLSVPYKPLMVNIIMVSVIVLNVVEPKMWHHQSKLPLSQTCHLFQNIQTIKLLSPCYQFYFILKNCNVWRHTSESGQNRDVPCFYRYLDYNHCYVLWYLFNKNRMNKVIFESSAFPLNFVVMLVDAVVTVLVAVVVVAVAVDVAVTVVLPQLVFKIKYEGWLSEPVVSLKSISFCYFGQGFLRP